MQKTISRSSKTILATAKSSWPRLALKFSGALALAWFLIRVIPKPSRASYPCQRAAFPLASSFVIWLCGMLTIKACGKYFSRGRLAAGGALVFLAAVVWTIISFTGDSAAQNIAPKKPSDWNFIPPPPNQPAGVARGIFPGRVVWARDPLATRWAGRWQQKTDQWWLDENTDQARVDHLLVSTLTRLTGKTNSAEAWRAIFGYYNLHLRQLEARGYQPGEIVAVKVNLNNSTKPGKVDNYIDATPQTILAMVRQLVNEAKVRPQDIVIYDVRRYIPPYILSKVWGDFPAVRFVQQSSPAEPQPKNPATGDYHNLEKVNWVEGITYSRDNDKYKDARLIPKQIQDATYLVNLAILKAHSYPYNEMDRGDSGQTGISMCGKNHFGSIKGPYELHSIINPDLEATSHFYSPLVDLAASPNLGAKTILYVLDGLYCGRKWQSYPQHFPNPPFNNRVEPYENSDWPASLLASLDGVALDSVGLDLIFAQTKNNNDTNGHPRILIRATADDYLCEMAQAEHPPSGAVYRQGGKTVTSLGVHEHWDSDATKQYSRNLDPGNGTGIELIYLPITGAINAATNSSAATEKKPATHAPYSPTVLPGNGLTQHPFLYCGEWDTRKPDAQAIFLVRDGKIVWRYNLPMKSARGGIQEFDDAGMLPNGNMVFSRMSGAGIVSPDKKLVWNYEAPVGTEVHSAQYLGDDRVLIMRNGNPAQAMIFNVAANLLEREILIPTTVTNPHAQFRHIRMTPAGTLLVPHMGESKVVEYDMSGSEIWSVKAPSVWAAVRLPNGNTLLSGNAKGYLREVNPAGGTVWEFTQKDAPDIKLFTIQGAERLANGNTVFCNWCPNGVKNQADWPTTVQVLEVTPEKKIAWALRSWQEPADLGPATMIQLLDEPGGVKRPGQAR
ncbi:MAG: DUF362 domain-containing protein [Verrucomicrobiota bacterium]